MRLAKRAVRRLLLAVTATVMATVTAVAVAASPASAFSGGGCRIISGGGFTLRACINGGTYGSGGQYYYAYFDVLAVPSSPGSCWIYWSVNPQYGWEPCTLGYHSYQNLTGLQPLTSSKYLYLDALKNSHSVVSGTSPTIYP